MANDENSIIERIRGGETSEFAQLVKRYGPSLMVFVGRIVGVQEDTEDVVQNTFVAAYQHLKDYDPQRASVSTWLQRIAYHEALYHLRKRKRQVMVNSHPEHPYSYKFTTEFEGSDSSHAIHGLPDMVKGHIYNGSDEFFLCCKREQDGSYHILTLNSKGVYWVPCDYAILKSYVNGEKTYLKGMEPKEDKK